MTKSSSKLRRERRQRQQKRLQNEGQQEQQPRVLSSAAAVPPNDILRSIFVYLKPILPLGSVGTLMLNQLARLQKAAGVNRQWRTTATRLFYRVAVVVMTMSLDDHNFGETRMRSNIRLIRNMRRVDSVREVQIAIEGKGQQVHELTRWLTLAGLWKSTWCGAFRLQIDMTECSAGFNGPPDMLFWTQILKIFNCLLSQALPSLRQIAFVGLEAGAYYQCVPIMKLINERLYGPKPLASLQIDSICTLEHDSYNHQSPNHPTALECMRIYTSFTFGSRDFPMMPASTLVHLRLGQISADWFWNSFVADDASGSSNGSLMFFSLKSLELTFCRPWQVVDRQDNATDLQELRSYTTSSTFGRPQFPALTGLDISFFPKNYEQFLSLFAASPIACLIFCISSYDIPSGINLSQFNRLRSLEVHFVPELTERNSRYVNECISGMFATTGSRLERLDMRLSATCGFQFRTTAPSGFALNITSLKLDDHIAMHDVGLLMLQLPKLIRLKVAPRVQRVISSDSELVRALQIAEAAQLLTPLSSSLKPMRLWRSKYCTSRGIPDPAEDYINHVSFFRTMIVELVCRLPSLEILWFNVSPINGVQDAIQALVDSGIASEHIGHLQHLQVRPMAE